MKIGHHQVRTEFGYEDHVLINILPGYELLIYYLAHVDLKKFFGLDIATEAQSTRESEFRLLQYIKTIQSKLRSRHF